MCWELSHPLEKYNNLISSCPTPLLFQWVDDIGGVEKLGEKLLRRRKNEKLPTFTPPEVVNL